eukprot:155855-Pyramimonas_sp.AAC.1
MTCQRRAPSYWGAAVASPWAPLRAPAATTVGILCMRVNSCAHADMPSSDRKPRALMPILAGPMA